MRLLRLIALTLTVTVLLAGPAAAHSEEEKFAWLEDWQQRMTHDGLTGAYVTEYWVFVGRHSPDGARVAPAPHTVAVAGSVEQWRPLVEQYFPAEAVNTMLCLIGHESNGDPQAENPTSSATGLAQILHSLWGPVFGVAERSGWHDPETNVAAARQIWDWQGYGAWSPFLRGLCHGL